MLEGIKFCRIDYRLIHGQVITKWSHIVSINQIVIVNDALANDEFMAGIYAMAAPSNMEVKTVTKETFVQNAKAGEYDEVATFLLFKSIEDCSEVVSKGINFKQVQIGGLGSGNGRTSVVKGISVDLKDIAKLEEIASKGAEVTFQVTPEEKKVALSQAKKKVEG